MSVLSSQINDASRPSFHVRSWLVFGLYIIIAAVATFHHELWGDEVHSWNIAKASHSFTDLVANTRYEGHPLAWYSLLFAVTKFSHDPFYMQCLHLAICCAAVFVLVFYSGFPLPVKILLLGGYYFTYEYCAISRNYAPGVLFAFLLCLVIYKPSRFQQPLYYILLLLLSNTHLVGLLLAVSFHVYFLATRPKPGNQSRNLFLHVCLGGLFLLPALYFIYPPVNSGLNSGFWLRIWSRDQFFVAMQAPLKALSPIPAWWEAHWWNTHFIIEGRFFFPFLKFVIPLASATLVFAACFVLWKHKKSLLLFCVNGALTLAIALIFPLTTARYVGFIYIGFVVALWLCYREGAIDGLRKKTLYLLLSLQVIGGVIAFQKDLSQPFSRFNDIKHIADIVPPDEPVITDYWCLNYLSAALDKPFSCIGFQHKKSFLLWDQEIKSPQDLHNYTKWIAGYNDIRMLGQVYLLTNSDVQELKQNDSLLFEHYRVIQVTAAGDCIEKHSSIYLYRISRQE